MVWWVEGIFSLGIYFSIDGWGVEIWANEDFKAETLPRRGQLMGPGHCCPNQLLVAPQNLFWGWAACLSTQEKPSGMCAFLLYFLKNFLLSSFKFWARLQVLKAQRHFLVFEKYWSKRATLKFSPHFCSLAVYTELWKVWSYFLTVWLASFSNPAKFETSGTSFGAGGPKLADLLILLFRDLRKIVSDLLALVFLANIKSTAWPWPI